MVTKIIFDKRISRRRHCRAAPAHGVPETRPRRSRSDGASIISRARPRQINNELLSRCFFFVYVFLCFSIVFAEHAPLYSGLFCIHGRRGTCRKNTARTLAEDGNAPLFARAPIVSPGRSRENRTRCGGGGGGGGGVVSSLLIIFGPTDSRNAVGTIHHGDGRSTGFSLLYGPGVGGEDSFKKLLISKRTSHYVSFKILFSCEQGRRNKRGGGGGGGGGGDIPT